jgi:VanZ family protein
LWLGLIVTESSNLGSSANTGRFLYPLLHYLFGIGIAHFEVLHVFIRKSGHVFGYAILCALLFRAWRATLPVPRGARWSFDWARLAWMTTTLVACLDEWHQAYLPTRGSSVHDVILDSTAGLAAQILIWYWLRRRDRGDAQAVGELRST